PALNLQLSILLLQPFIPLLQLLETSIGAASAGTPSIGAPSVGVHSCSQGLHQHSFSLAQTLPPSTLTQSSLPLPQSSFLPQSTLNPHHNTRRVLSWGEGYYSGDIKTRKTSQGVELNSDQIGLQRSEQLRELYKSRKAVEASPQTKRRSAALSPEDLTDTEGEEAGWDVLITCHMHKVMVNLIMQELQARGINNKHTLAYQNQVGPIQWLKPYTDETLIELGQIGVKSLLAVPV
ncbi:hypothetical protein HN51_061900, partial [Arachis hypogaea]